MELRHLVEVDVEGDVGVADDDVVLRGFEHEAAQHIQRLYLPLVHLVSGVEHEGRIDGNAAVLAVEVPVAPLTDVVHQAVVVVLGDDADLGDVGMDEVGEHEVDETVSARIRQRRRRTVYRQIVEMAVFVGCKQYGECVVFHVLLLILSFRPRPRRCLPAARSPVR